MKKKKKLFKKVDYAIIAIILFLVVIIIFSIFKNNSQEDYSKLWLIYDNNIETIKNNMDIIATEHEKFPWGLFNDTKEVPLYKEDLDELIIDITNCYVYFVGLTDIYTDADEILRYRNNIDKYTGYYYHPYCINQFGLHNYSDQHLESINSYSNFEKIIDEIRKVNSNYYDIYNTNDFNEFLTRQVLETTYVSKLTNALVIEYYKLNNGGI